MPVYSSVRTFILMGWTTATGYVKRPRFSAAPMRVAALG
jgi:hypothetical protein